MKLGSMPSIWGTLAGLFWRWSQTEETGSPPSSAGTRPPQPTRTAPSSLANQDRAAPSDADRPVRATS